MHILAFIALHGHTWTKCGTSLIKNKCNRVLASLENATHHQNTTDIRHKIQQQDCICCSYFSHLQQDTAIDHLTLIPQLKSFIQPSCSFDIKLSAVALKFILYVMGWQPCGWASTYSTCTRPRLTGQHWSRTIRDTPTHELSATSADCEVGHRSTVPSSCQDCWTLRATATDIVVNIQPSLHSQQTRTVHTSSETQCQSKQWSTLCHALHVVQAVNTDSK